MVALLSGCAGRREFVGTHPFRFDQDTFAYANELVWEYRFDEQGNWIHERREPPPDYTHHCFVVARAARQFFQHARFDPQEPVASEEVYRERIRRVVGIDPARVLDEHERIVIPGYANLREFSEAWEPLLKQECGGAWRSYFQRGHWRIVFPFTRRNQADIANRLLECLDENRPPVVHLVRFPQLTINHALLVFDAKRRPGGIEFAVYDPNKPDSPKALNYDAGTRTFTFAANDYFPGGRVDVYEIYRSLRY